MQWWRKQNSALLDGLQETKEIRLLKPEDTDGRFHQDGFEVKGIIQTLNKLNNKENAPSQIQIYA
jgi:hypothetical protein